MPNEQLNLEVVQIVRDWNNLVKRTEYERRLNELGPTAVETLLVLVRRDVKRNRLHRYTGIAFIVLSLAINLISYWVDHKSQKNLLLFITFGQFLCLMLGMVFLAWYPHRSARVLSDFDDVRIVGSLLEACEDIDAATAIHEALTRILPQMKASDAHMLNTHQKKKLYEMIGLPKLFGKYGRNEDETLQLVILRALQQIGDGAAMPYVEKLANPPAGAKVSKEVQEAARECLPFLTQRAEQERLSMTLLRAAGTMETQSGELLRPAATNVESDPRALLRATQQD